MLDWIESNVLDYFSFNCFNDFIDKDELYNVSILLGRA